MDDTSKRLAGAMAAQLIHADVIKLGDQVLTPIAMALAREDTPENRAAWDEARENCEQVLGKLIRKRFSQATCIVKYAKAKAELDRLKAETVAKASDRMAERVAEMRKGDAKLATVADDRIIAKIAASREPADIALWHEYRAEKDAGRVLTIQPVDPAGLPTRTKPPADPTGDVEPPARSQEAPRVADSAWDTTDTASRRALEAMIDQHVAEGGRHSLNRQRARNWLLANSRDAQRLLLQHGHEVAAMNSPQDFGKAAETMPSEGELRRTIYGMKILNAIDTEQVIDPKMRRGTARARVLGTDGGQTDLRRHRQTIAAAASSGTVPPEDSGLAPNDDPAMAARIAELRRGNAAIKSDAAALAKIAESRAPGDVALWKSYRAKLDDSAEIAKIAGPVTKAAAHTTPPFDATPHGQEIERLALATMASHPNMSRERAIARVIGTPHGAKLVMRHHQHVADHVTS